MVLGIKTAHFLHVYGKKNQPKHYGWLSFRKTALKASLTFEKNLQILSFCPYHSTILLISKPTAKHLESKLIFSLCMNKRPSRNKVLIGKLWKKKSFTRLWVLFYIVCSLLAVAMTKAEVAETAFLLLERQTSLAMIYKTSLVKIKSILSIYLRKNLFAKGKS